MKYVKINHKYRVVEGGIYPTGIRPEKDIHAEHFTIKTNGDYIIIPGFTWNGSDYVADTPESMIASALHDITCQVIQDGRLDKKWKLQGDLEYFKYCRTPTIQGKRMSFIRASWRLAAIQFHKWQDTKPDKEIYEV